MLTINTSIVPEAVLVQLQADCKGAIETDIGRREVALSNDPLSYIELAGRSQDWLEAARDMAVSGIALAFGPSLFKKLSEKAGDAVVDAAIAKLRQVVAAMFRALANAPRSTCVTVNMWVGEHDVVMVVNGDSEDVATHSLYVFLHRASDIAGVVQSALDGGHDLGAAGVRVLPQDDGSMILEWTNRWPERYVRALLPVASNELITLVDKQ